MHSSFSWRCLWKSVSIVRYETITNLSFSDCLQGSSAAPSALLQLPWELIFCSKCAGRRLYKSENLYDQLLHTPIKKARKRK